MRRLAFFYPLCYIAFIWKRKRGGIMREHTYENYKKKSLEVYRDERWEAYYYPILKEFLNGCCEKAKRCYEGKEQGIKIVCVGVNKFRKKEGSELHRRCAYAAEGGMPDLIAVPEAYDYEHATAPFASIEVKRLDPGNGSKGYQAVEWQANYGQLETQFQKTDSIIYTDCITWHFLKRPGTAAGEPICLWRDGSAWNWAPDAEWERLKSRVRGFICGESI